MANLTPDFQISDRRSTSRIELGREDAVPFLRALGEAARDRDIEAEIIATRGERLGLVRLRIRVAGGDVGHSEIVHLHLFEVDGEGRSSYYARWDEHDLEAARAELDARWREARPLIASPGPSKSGLRFRGPPRSQSLLEGLPDSSPAPRHRAGAGTDDGGAPRRFAAGCGDDASSPTPREPSEIGR